MKIFVKVKAGARTEKVSRIDDLHFLVSVKEIPLEGKANKAVINALAEYLKLSKSQIMIITCFASREKIISIS